MNLYIDIGNTSTKFAIDDGDSVQIRNFIATKDIKSKSKEIIAKLREFKFDNIFVCSVAPTAAKRMSSIIRRSMPADRVKIISPLENTDVKIDIENPSELGTDILCDLVAANKLNKKPTLIIDCGTASKVIYLPKNGVFTSCVIVPGLELSMNTLSSNTELLNKVSFTNPKKYLDCHNTNEVINSSIIFSHVDLIEGTIKRYANQIGETPNIILTGGYAKYLRDYFSFKFEEIDNLCLIGLKEICRNK